MIPLIRLRLENASGFNGFPCGLSAIPVASSGPSEFRPRRSNDQASFARPERLAGAPRASLAMFMAPTRCRWIGQQRPYRYMVHCTTSDLKFELVSELVNGRRGPPGLSGSSDAGT